MNAGGPQETLRYTVFLDAEPIREQYQARYHIPKRHSLMNAHLKRLSPEALRKRPLLSAALLLTALLGAGAAYFLLRSPSPADRYVTAQAQAGDIEDATTAQGSLQPLNYVDVGTQVSGQLRKIAVELGDKVEAGQLLAEIDPTILGSKVDAGQAQIQSLRAQLAEKQAQLLLANEQFERQERMLKANATSQDAYQSALASQKAAQAQVAQLTAQIRQTESSLKGDQANLGYTRIYAPMAGTVVSLPARQGQTLNANQQAPTILRIADLSAMTVWTQVSEADIGRLKLGQEVYFTTLGAPDKRYSGVLRQILPTPETVNNVILYDALFDVPNENDALMIEMTAQVFFVHAKAKNAVLVPVSALSVGNGGKGRQAKANGEDKSKATLLVMKNGVAEPRAVTLGVRNRVQAQVTEGLEAGEEVVIAFRQKEAASASGKSSSGAMRMGPPP